jgi:hypothetical protein
MMVVMLVVGIGCLLAGILAIGFGIPVKEFSFGNTLILAGAVAACTGLVILGLWAVVRELRIIAQRLGPAVSLDLEGAPLQPAVATSPSRQHVSESGGFLFSRDEPGGERVAGAESDSHPSAPPSVPWQNEAVARSPRGGAVPVPEPVETAPAVKPKRNLMFSSSSRRERERMQARATAEASVTDLNPVPAAVPPAPEIGEAAPAALDSGWTRPERSRPVEAPARRGGRAPSTFSEATSGAAEIDHQPSAVHNEDQPPVTVLKSGVVDGMAYSLYSDGSIEAQMPEGMMRFASIDELRSHLDQRP